MFIVNTLTAVDHNKVNLISYKALFIYYHNMLVKYQNQKNICGTHRVCI